MKRLIATFGLCSLIALAACGKSGENEAKAPATSAAPVTEQEAGSITDKTVEVGKETWEKTKEMTTDAADAVATKSKEVYEDTKDAVSEAGTAVKDKAVEMGTTVSDATSDAYNSAKKSTSEMIDVTKEKGAEMLQDATKE
ncbi:MAG: hypothetical protein KZQ93_13960 [Candidatus Thiodiazotropha sp. (ex Monitilora ramsayi)]|nr:hypothetical protein [Candidatus Thiodiazotropha sp. (ex Monitilora ramsayi)]